MASVSMSMCNLNWLDAILPLTYLQSPPQKQFLLSLNILYALIQNWWFGKDSSIFFCETKNITVINIIDFKNSNLFLGESKFKVCAKSEGYEKMICFLYIFSYLFLGVEEVFVIKNDNFQAFFLQEVGFLYSAHYFHLTFILSWMN